MVSYRRFVVAAFATVLVVTAAPAPPAGSGTDPCAEGLCPDLRAVVPTHLGVQNSHQRETVRFTNGVANTGRGHATLRPEFPLGDPSQPQLAVQEILDAAGHVVHEEVVSSFEYHAEHHHWHVADVALFEIRRALDDGRGGSMGVVLTNDRGLAQSVKTTFCLIDVYAIEGNSRTPGRTYWDCNGERQGISPGWVDQYHQSLPDQELDVTGAPPGVYYLLTTSNPTGALIETDHANNTAWRSFRLRRDSKGNAKISLIAHSPCDPGLCGETTANR